MIFESTTDRLNFIKWLKRRIIMSQRLRVLIFGRSSSSSSCAGMRGLSNNHMSCCVNTLLQSLNATWEVAELLERWDTAGVSEESHNVPLQLKKTLAAMKSDHPQHDPHREFLRCLDRNRIRLSVQHDADEVFSFIHNFIQQQMNNNALALEIQNLYKINLETQVQCLKCNSVQSRPTYLLSLPLHIKEGRNTLESCIASFFEDQELSGENCCLCAQCDTKTPSKRGVKLLSLPHILCIHLKRFRNHHGSTRKLDCEVTFPETLDFSTVPKESLLQACPQNEYKYTLYAVVVHSGIAICGHYTGFVRQRENQRWYYADDCHVHEASWQEVKKTYGERSRGTAYILMYRRETTAGGQHPELSG